MFHFPGEILLAESSNHIVSETENSPGIPKRYKYNVNYRLLYYIVIYHTF